MTIMCFEKMNGERIIAEIETIENGVCGFYTLKNPLSIHHSRDGASLGFAPCLYSDPKEMNCKLYMHSVSMQHVPADEIANAYTEYVKRLTSSLIHLDTKIQKPILNG